jgi:HAE1 family hydrophobic/amphiphilic exporter-1
MKEHPFDWNAKLVKFFLHNTRLVWMLLIGIIIGGTFALMNLQRQGFPEVTPKVAVIQTVFPGATADEMERQVTSVIEGAVKDVKGLKQTSSTSASSFSNVVVTLDESVTLDTAIQDIQSKVQAARGDLPSDIEQPEVKTFSTSGPAFIYGITEPEKSLEEIRAEADAFISAVSNVEGVKSAKVFSDVPERITVAFDPAKLAQAGVTLQTVQLVLQGANVNFPAGSLTIGDRTTSVVSVGAFGTLDDIANLIVGVNTRTNQPVRLRDVAQVTRGHKAEASIDRFGYRVDDKLVTQPGILVSIEATKGSDVIRVREALDVHIEKLREEGAFSEEMEIVTLSDQAEETEMQIAEIASGAIGNKQNFFILGGIQLLFLAMLLFVNWRAALVAALSIPISLLFTFLTLILLGVQLNTIVLFSLILVLGLIVDPAIVMVEAIQRYRDLKYERDEAILESGRRYGTSLFMAVLTSMIVFVPFGVVSGIFGEIIKYIPLTVLPALFASYLIPIGILPLFTKFLLKTHKPAHKDDGKAHEIAGLSPAAEWLMSLNRSILNRRWKQIATLVASFALVAGSLSLIATGKVQSVQFSKPNDNPNISVSATFTPGLPYADRNATAKKLENLLTSESGIDHFFYYDQNSQGVFLWARLREKHDREPTDYSKEIVTRLREKVKTITNTSDIIVNEVGSGTPEPDYQITSQLYDTDPAVLETAAKDVGAFLAKQPKVIKVDDGFTDRGQPELRVVLNRTNVQAAGLSSFEIGQQLKAVIGETTVTKYAGEGGAADVILTNGALPNDIEAVKNLPLVNRNGQIVLVRSVASVESSTAVSAIQRFDGSRFVTIRARVDGNNTDVFAVQKSLNEYLTQDKLKSLGIDSNESRGEFDDIAKSFSELGIALVVAVFLTYIVLVLQFKSFSQPLVMLVTVPLSFIGVFPALWLTGSDVGFLELLGVTILVGIVENVAIFLMDYANQLVDEQGLSPKDAIIQATGVRFRPILLTKLVALGGLMPLAIESEFWRGLSVTIMAGIGLSGFLSLVVIPILYVWIQGGRTRFHRRFGGAK